MVLGFITDMDPDCNYALHLRSCDHCQYFPGDFIMSSETEDCKKCVRMWDFCCQHPVATFFIILVLFSGLEGVISAFTGHYEPSDGCGVKVDHSSPNNKDNWDQ